jgi:ribonuclease-3
MIYFKLSTKRNPEDLSMAALENQRNQYQRLEFIGDRVLNLIVSDFLYQNFPDESEGFLTNKLRFTSNDNLDEILENLDKKFLGELAAFKTRFKPGNIELSADDLEAFIGESYLARGFAETKQTIEKFLADEIRNYNPDTDYISRLQIFTQQNAKPYPDYRFEPDKILPNNEHEFHVRVFIDGVMFGEGIGNRKSRANQKSAKMALEKLGCLK